MAQKLLKLISHDSSDSAHVQIPRPSLRPTFKPWAKIIDQIAVEEAALPKRLQTTAMRIFKKLREEHGYTGCYNVVQGYVHQARVAANPNYRARRSRKKPSREKQYGAAKLKSRLREASTDGSFALSNQMDRPHHESQNTGDFRRSLYPARQRLMPEGVAYDWMHSIEQGTIGLETIEEQIPELQHSELIQKGDPPALRFQLPTSPAPIMTPS